MNKEQKKPQEDIFDEFDKKFTWLAGDVDRDEVTDIRSDIKDWIKVNFIAKRDLRKLLEEYRNGYKDSYGVTEEGKRYYRGLEWAEGYNSALDDILAEIEKL